jgi:fatty-acyl-CoA synthase
LTSDAAGPVPPDLSRPRPTAAPSFAPPAGPGVPGDLVAQARRHGVGDLLHRTACRFPEKTAIVSEGRRLTYREFDDLVNRIARALQLRGVAKADRIALLSHNCWQYVVTCFALAKLGAVLVPVNFMLRAHEVAYILEHCGATGMITEDVLAPTAEAALQAAGTGGSVRGWINLAGIAPGAGWEDVESWAAHTDAGPPQVLVADDDPLRLMYTSGTESRPKGVLLSSRSLIAQYVSCIVDGEMSAADIEVHALPMYHCAQLDCFFCPDVYLGATSIILRGPDPVDVLRAIETEHATKLFAPPTVWISLLRCPAIDTTDLSSLRKGYYGASAMPVEVLKEIQRRLPQVRLWNFYGQTEMAPVATILPPEEQLSHPGSAGRAVLNVETAVVDDDDVPVAAGVTGEIVHRSPQTSLGYYHDDAKTAEAFRGGWFHSGDLGVLDPSGRLTIVDRKKDIIKSGGENVASREVEEAIYALDGVVEVAAFGVAHPRWIEAVAVVVIPRAGAGLTADVVLAHCRDRLAPYKVPKFVVLGDELPKNPSGKVLKRELRQAHSDLAQQEQ